VERYPAKEMGMSENDMKKQLKILKDNLPEHLEFMWIKAKLKREGYMAYLSEGFTPEQALELCKDEL
jgi:hypothetical protein